jgi:hypothetical protein
MNPIARMMKRYIKMPQKSAFSLLVVCVILLSLLLSCTTGCLESYETVDSRTTEGYKGYTIKKELSHGRSGGLLGADYKQEVLFTNNGSIVIVKKLNKDGDLKQMTQTVNGKTTTADFTGKGDPLPGNKAIERVIDNLTATPTPTVTSTPVPEIIEITPSSEGEHSHIEGGV